ncbi:carboxypeptidase regulatory-like domain-containing protein [bacterium]|nr:carboxypeptidase regulatory-like domain-containing protein [bacterium]
MNFLRTVFWTFFVEMLVIATSAHSQTNLTWTKTYPTVHDGYAFVLSPLNNNVVYIHDNVEKIFKVSYDAGSTWSTRGSISQGPGIRTIRVSPLDTSIIVMVGNNGILRSTNGGFDWEQVKEEGSTDGESFDYNIVHPDTMYFVDFYTSEFWLSADTGRTWHVRSVVPYGNVCTIAADPFHPNVIVIGAGDTKIARSTDYGLTWTLVKGGNPYFSECPKIVWDKSTPNMVYAAIQLDAAYSFFRSTDGGVTWNDMGLYGIFMWGLDQDPVNGDLFIGVFGSRTSLEVGIYRSADKGKSWQQLGNLFTYPAIWMIKAATSHDVYALNQDALGTNLYKLNTNPSGYGKISGTITTTSGGLPVGHASVVVVGGSDSCIVNNTDGKYTMYLSPGTYSLKAQSAGVNQVIGNVNVNAGGTTDVNFQLSLNGTMGSIGVSVVNVYQDDVNSTVLLYGRYGNGTLFPADTLSGNTFTNLSSLNFYDSIVVISEAPYVRQSIAQPSLNSNYEFNIDRADVFVMVDIAFYGTFMQSHLLDSGYTTYLWDLVTMGRSLPVEAIEKTKRRVIIWSASSAITTTTAFLDTLSLLCDRGVHLFAAGPDLVELHSSHPLFQNKLGVGFNGNYTSSSSFKGFTANKIGDGITTSIALGGSTRDKLTLLNSNVHKAFYYGPNYDPDSVNVGGVNVDNTGHGARGVFISAQIYRLFENSNMGKILARSLKYFGNSSPAPLGTSILQNPALSKYFDMVVVTDTAFSGVPTVKMWVTGLTDTTSIAMAQVNGTNKVYRGASVFSVSGTYNFRIKATTSGGRDSIQTRTYGVTLAKPGQIASVTTPNGQGTLQMSKHSVKTETYMTASDESETVVKFGPESDYAEELVLTMTYAQGNFADEGKVFIYQKTGDTWTPLRTQVYAEKHQVRALVKTLGEFKVGLDATFTGNNVVPKEFTLKQNYPNPFNPSTTIAFDLPQDGTLKLVVYNLLGQRVKTLYSGFQLAGSYRISWDGKNELGQQVASGVYLYRVEAGAFVKTKKMMLIK